MAVLAIGQPTLAEQWARMAPSQQPRLASRQVQIHAGELLASLADDRASADAALRAWRIRDGAASEVELELT